MFQPVQWGPTRQRWEMVLAKFAHTRCLPTLLGLLSSQTAAVRGLSVMVGYLYSSFPHDKSVTQTI